MIEQMYFVLYNPVQKHNEDGLNEARAIDVIFKMYSYHVYNHAEFINDTLKSYFSSYDLYKFYNIDMYRTSFLFFANVRHSTKLEIV